jgi:hypothetical protein
MAQLICHLEPRCKNNDYYSNIFTFPSSKYINKSWTHGKCGIKSMKHGE